MGDGRRCRRSGVVLLCLVAGVAWAQSGNPTAKKRTAPAGVTVAQLSRLNVVNKVETGECLQQQIPGVGIPCHGGLGASSWGDKCYVYNLDGDGFKGTEKITACVDSCPARMSNAMDCTYRSCMTALASRTYFQTYASLGADVKARIASDYDTLIKLAKASGTPAYGALGGDAKRLEVKRDILGVVMAGLIDDDTQKPLGPGTMLPFSACEFAEAGRREGQTHQELLQFNKYGSVPEAETENAADTAPMETTVSGDLKVYEAAFYTCSAVEKSRVKCLPGATYTPDPPDLLAAEIVHELVHYKQKKYGHEAPPGVAVDAGGRVKNLLNEIEAYAMSKDDLFYRDALTPQERSEASDAGLKAQVTTFQKMWPGLDKSTKDDVAMWAVNQNWMKARILGMTASPEEGNVWRELCVAVKDKDPYLPCGLPGRLLP